jgi:hypothetical protein
MIECEVFTLKPGDKALTLGEESRLRNLELYAECKRNGKWPGGRELKLPGWAYTGEAA